MATTSEREPAFEANAYELLRRIAAASATLLEPDAAVRTVLEDAMRMLGADAGGIYLVGGDTLHLVAGLGASANHPDLQRIPIAGHFARQLLRTRAPYQWGLPQAAPWVRKLLEATDLRLLATTAIPAAGATVGLFHVARHDERPFTPSELELLGTIGALLGPALSTALHRVDAPGGQRGTELTALQRVSFALSRAMRLDQVFEICLDFADELLRPETGAIYLLNEARQEFELAAGRRLRDDPVSRRTRFPAWVYTAAGLSTHRTPLLLRADDGKLAPEQRAALNQTGLSSTLLVPLCSNDRLVGLLGLGFDQRHTISTSVEDTLAAIGDQLGTAIDRARLYALAEQRARQAATQHRHLMQLVDRLPFPVAVVDPNLIFLQVNSVFERLTGLVVGASLRASFGRLQIRDDRGGLVEISHLAVARALRGEEQHAPLEFMFMSTLGPRAVFAWAMPLRDANGGVTAAVLALEDITCHRELSAAKDRFFAIASHELRNPLAVLRSSVALLTVDPAAGAEERRRQLVGRIDRQVHRLSQLIDDFMDAARARAEGIAIQREAMDLRAAVIEEVKHAQLEWPTHQFQLIAPDEIQGCWDRQRIGQVVANLLSNAVRYSPQGTIVTIETGTHNGTAFFSVEDRGIGIPEALHATLFDPYTRTRESGALAPQGLGLGLYIAREITRCHGGTVSLASQVGRGTKFTVELPR